MWYITILVLGLADGIDALPDALPDAIPIDATDAAGSPIAKGAEPWTLDGPKNKDDGIETPPLPATAQSRTILRYERRCGEGGCILVPIYAEESVAEAAEKLQGWRGLPAEEAERLAGIVDAPARAKARAGHWDAGSCEMLCTIPSHGTHWVWDDPKDDGTPEPAWGSWGVNGAKGRRGKQVEYPIRRWKN